MNEVGCYLVRLGYGADYSRECIERGYIAVDHEVGDISDLIAGGDSVEAREKIKDLHRECFSEEPSKGSVSAQCGTLFRFCWMIQNGDLVLSPTDDGEFAIGRVSGDYYFDDNGDGWPHRRKVDWLRKNVSSDSLTYLLYKSTKQRIQTLTDLSGFAKEVDALTQSGNSQPRADSGTFALERHFEDFLVANWQNCGLGDNYDVYQDEDGLFGKQFPTDTGYIDILAVSKDQKELLVVELKRDKAADATVGQVQRYMGFIREEVASEDQTVKGCIIALGDDVGVKRALSVAPDITFYRYEISFKLVGQNDS